MISQELFNMVTGVCGLLGGWWLNTVWAEVKSLRRQNQELQTKVAAIEVLVAGQYVRRDDLDKFGNVIFDSLRRIEMKLDGKADKP